MPKLCQTLLNTHTAQQVPADSNNTRHFNEFPATLTHKGFQKSGQILNLPATKSTMTTIRQYPGGDELRIIRSADTGGEGVTELEFRMAPGGTCGFHFHKQFIKTLLPVEGTLAYLQKGRDLRMLRPGDSHSIAPGTLHRYFNPGTGLIRFRVVLEPGHPGYEQGWIQWFALAEQGKLNRRMQARNLAHFLRLRVMKDMHWGGWKRPLNRIASLCYKML